MTSVNGKKTISGFEKLLFGFTRIFVLGGSLLALIAIVVFLFGLFEPDEKTKKSSFVSLYDLRPTQQKEKNRSVHSEFEAQLPANVKKYMFEKNVNVLYGWIKSLDKTDQEDFMENLSLIIDQAENGTENVVDIINEYKTVKLEKLKKPEFEKYEAMVRKGAILSAIFGLVLFIALMSLILVVLAVERNTRVMANKAS
ncbi:MAG: hypothetical protein ABH869_00445 [Candidatus Omnitrophota bacterium]